MKGKARGSRALSTAQTWLVVKPAQDRHFLGWTCSHPCLEGLAVLGKGLSQCHCREVWGHSRRRDSGA